jgi:hypothetical protein
MRRFNLSLVFYLLLVFLSGVVVGVLGDRFHATRSVKARNPYSPEEMRQRYVEDLRSRLKLSDEQLQQLTAILGETHDRFRELRKKYGPETRAIQDAQIEKIRSMLNEKQRAEYEKMRQERDRRRQRPGH